LCESSYDPHRSHKTSISSSNQITSQFRTVDQAEICSFNSSIETGLDGLSNNEDSEMNNGFSELQCEEDFYNNIQVAQNSTKDGPAAIPFALHKNK
jgi:hypothetical protein